MAVSRWLAQGKGVICSLCRDEPATIHSVLTVPLIVSVHTYTCPSCYSTNARATASLMRADSSLVLTEVAA